MATATVSSPSPPSIAPGAPIPLPADICERLDAGQMAWLQQRLSNRASTHAIDYRVSTSVFGARFYVSLIAGREMRSTKRLQQEGLSRRFSQVAFEIGVFCLAATVMVATVIGFAVGIVWLLDRAFDITNLPDYLDKLFH